MQRYGFSFFQLLQSLGGKIIKDAFPNFGGKSLVYRARRFCIDLRSQGKQLAIRQLADFLHQFGNTHVEKIPQTTLSRKFQCDAVY